MKKIYYSVVSIALLALFFLGGCKKVNEGPFPTRPHVDTTFSTFSYITPLFPGINDASGILISAQVHNQKTVIVTPFQSNYEYGMAQFTSTPGNFTSLVNMDSIWLNGVNLAESNTFSYLSSTSTFSINLSGSASWQLKGNSNIPKLGYTLNGVYPTFSDSFQNWPDNWLPVQKLNPDTFTVRIPINYKSYVTNADSVVVSFINGNYVAQQKHAATDAQAIFHSWDFPSGFPAGSTNLILQINAIKYRDTVVNSKKYYFLKMGSYIKYYTATK